MHGKWGEHQYIIRQKRLVKKKDAPSCKTSRSVTLSLEMAMSLTFALASSRVTLLRSFFSIRSEG